MDIDDAIRTRRSIRRFTTEDVPDTIVTELLELACWSPSAGNLQARDFVVVRDPKIKQALADAAFSQQFVASAPVVIVVCANSDRSARRYGYRGKTLYCIQDADTATLTILLALHAKGLGSCWVGAFDENKASSALELPETIRPVAILPIGHPAEKKNPPKRLPLEKLVHHERW
jgi:nitroreductase